MGVTYLFCPNEYEKSNEITKTILKTNKTKSKTRPNFRLKKEVICLIKQKKISKKQNKNAQVSFHGFKLQRLYLYQLLQSLDVFQFQLLFC